MQDSLVSAIGDTRRLLEELSEEVGMTLASEPALFGYTRECQLFWKAAIDASPRNMGPSIQRETLVLRAVAAELR